MSKWLLLMSTACLIIIATSSPILNEETKTKNERVSRQSNEVASAAASAAVAAAPQASASPASSNSEDDDDDDDDDEDDDLDLTDDDDDEEESETASDDDDDDDEDYDFERILDDILGDDDDEEEEEEEEAASDAVSAAPQAAVSSTTTAAAPIQGLAASPIEEVAEQNIEQAVISNDEEDQVADENNSHTVTLLTNSQPDDVDEAQEQLLNSNDLGTAASETISTAVVPTNQASAATSDDDDDEDEDEEDEDEDNVLGDDDDEDEDEEEDDEARKARNMQGGAVPVPSSYIAKYNNYVDTIFGRINKVLKKNYDPVNVRLQTAPAQKKPTAAKNSSKYKKKQPTARPSSRNDEPNNSTSVATRVNQDKVQHRSARRVRSRKSRLIQKRKTQTKATSSPKPSKKTMRAKATLYGLSSLRRDGDVIVHVMNTHTFVKSKFLVGPLTLKVEKEFGRGAKKEMRSATATTAEMFGKLNLKVVHGGDVSLSSIKVMQPKQMRVETPDDNDKTREFLWKRSSNLAHLVSQKITNAAKSFMKPVIASSIQNQTTTR